MKVSASITDFPVFSQLDTFFKEFKNAGVDGVELVLGVKSRFAIKQLQKLVKKYDLPITSVHQPAWSGVGLYFDERFVEAAKHLGTNKIVCHPLTFLAFDDKKMQQYFKRLSLLQEQYGIHIMLENMPNDFVYKKLHPFAKEIMRKHLQKMEDIVDTYGFLMTYDVSHAEFKKPQEEKIFQSLLPKIGNIHLSSFHKHQHHLPLTMGDLDSKGFLSYLKKKKYSGLVTFEVYYPKVLMVTNTYEFSAIADSVKVFRKIAGK